MALGCDTATAVTAAKLQTIIDKKMTFIGRYLNRVEGVHDELTAAEIKRINDAGLYIFSYYQVNGTTEDDHSHFTRANGVSDAKDAIKLAGDLGQPANTPIYFAVDYDATSKDMTSIIVPYFQGVLSVLDGSDYKLGIYGSYYVCQYIRGSYSATERYTCVSAVVGKNNINSTKKAVGEPTAFLVLFFKPPCHSTIVAIHINCFFRCGTVRG